MSLDNYILKGKNNRKTREQLMLETKTDKQTFRQELAHLKKTKIVLFDDGYYKPNTKQEYEEFKEKCRREMSSLERLYCLASEEEEKL